MHLRKMMAAMVVAGMACVFVQADGTNEGGKVMPINGVLNVWSYGYKVTCELNGQNVSIDSGGSTSARLMNKEHPMYAQVLKQNAELAKRLFLLKAGANTVKLHYEHTRSDANDYVEASLNIDGYPIPVFVFHAGTTPSGTLEGNFELAAKAPEGFRTLVKTDQPQGRFAFINLGDDGGSSIQPVLNGKKQMSTNVPGVIALGVLQPKSNTLKIDYKAGPAGMHLAVVGPKGVQYVAKPAGAQGTETLTIDAF